MSDNSQKPSRGTDEHDLGDLLREKEKLDSLIKRKFTRNITVMFTDLSGSTQLADDIGDIAMRSLLNKHYEIIIPAVEMNAGQLVKTMGDGTLSYFEDASDGIRAAAQIENSMAKFNEDAPHKLYIRCGLNTGRGIVEKNDVYGDVVNVAQRYEALAKPLEILTSHETFELSESSDDLVIIPHKETEIRGKIGPQRVYKVLWRQSEIDEAKKNPSKFSDFESDHGLVTTGNIKTSVADPAEVETSKKSLRDTAQIKVVRSGLPTEVHEISGKKSVLIGRSAQCDITIPEQYVSRKHAKIFKEDKDFFIEDQGSHIGTKRDGERILKSKMRDGEEYFIGSVRLHFATLTQTELSEKFSTLEEPTMAFAAGSIYTLVLKSKDEIVNTFDISSKQLAIGRQLDCDIVLDSPMVSRKHAQIFVKDRKVILEDLDSNNGTYLDGERIKSTELGHCDEVAIGPFNLQVIDPTNPSDPNADNKGFVGKVFSFLKRH